MEGASKPRLREQVRTVMRTASVLKSPTCNGSAISYAFINCNNRRNSVLLRSMPFSPGLPPNENVLPIDNQEISTATMLSNG